MSTSSTQCLCAAITQNPPAPNPLVDPVLITAQARIKHMPCVAMGGTLWSYGHSLFD